MAGFGTSTLSIASVLAAQAYVEARPEPAAPQPTPIAEALSALEATPTDGIARPIGDVRRARRWSTLGAARRAVL